MSAYSKMVSRQRDEFCRFPLGVACSRDEFIIMLEKWGITESNASEVCQVAENCFVRKSDCQAFKEMIQRHRSELHKTCARFPGDCLVEASFNELHAFTCYASNGFTKALIDLGVEDLVV